MTTKRLYSDMDSLLDAVDLGLQLADAFHRYQLALADRSYWHGDTAMREEITAKVDSAFAECLRLTHQIREGM